MADLLTFIEHALRAAVPAECVAWLRRYVDPEEALDQAHARHLLWLSSCAELQTLAELKSVTLARIDGLRAYERTQEDLPASGTLWELEGATERLRRAMRATCWWTAFIERWEARQSRGLGVMRYDIRSGLVKARVRGTHVGRFAVRQLRWPDTAHGRRPALRYREQTPVRWRECAGPQHLYAVDLVAAGRSLGSFASAAVAFEVADRLGRRGVMGTSALSALQRLLDAHRGSPPALRARSWPAEPHWRFATCRRRVWGRRRKEVRHAPR